jgi:hypothetical protein
MARVYTYADAAALDEREGLFDYRHPVGDYTHLAPPHTVLASGWNPPACLPERAEGFSIADEPRRGWPAPGPEQGRLFDA